MNAWAATDLLVTEAVHRTIEPADVETLWLRAAGTAGDDDPVALLQGFARHADLDKLRAVVHFESPLLRATAAVFDLHRHEWMRIDEVKLRDDTFDADLPAAVINARDRMMCMRRQD